MKRREWLAGIPLVVLAGCRSKPKSEPKRYKLVGEVVRLNAEKKIATIKHEKIEGWMEAMTMDFPVKADGEWAKLKEGAKINATVVHLEDELEYWLEDITVVG